MQMDLFFTKGPMSKVVYFHPKLHYPPLGGADLSSYEMIEALQRVGFTPFLFLPEDPEMPSKNPDYPLIRVPATHRSYLRLRFTDYIQKINPDMIFMNYILWDDILDHDLFSGIKRVIYNHEWASVRKKGVQKYIDLWNRKARNSLEDIDDSLCNEYMYPEGSLEADPIEAELFDQYDVTLTVPDPGSRFIQENTRKTKVFTLPCTLPPVKTNNRYLDFAILPIPSHTVNFQGYYFFVKKILPLILKKNPFFRLRVLGPAAEKLFPTPGVVLVGHVEDLKEEYEKARMLISPMYGGTGQQLKILEAMSHGVPSVSFHNPLQYNPTVHGETGFIARTAEEFAEYVLLLSFDGESAAATGKRARHFFEKNFTSEKLLPVFTYLKRLAEGAL